MEPAAREPSRTAVMAAVARALHRRQPPPWVFDDPLALGLAGDQAPAMLEMFERQAPPEVALDFSLWACVRSRAIEDMLERAVEAGVRQYVLLGAGLDSFAYRRPDLVPRVRVFEVDHPASQAWKRRRLAEMGVDIPPGVVFAPVDFERQALRDGLGASGFDFAAPAFFSLIGVTMYLTVEAIRATLATVAGCAAGTQIALTYNVPPGQCDDLGRRRHEFMTSFTAGLKEPWITFFTGDEITALLREAGYGAVELFDEADGVRRYFPGQSDVRIGIVQRIALATVAGDPPPRTA